MDIFGLKNALTYAQENQVALGHFNVSTIDAIHAIISAAKSLSVPIVIGVSEGERDFLGVKETAALIHTIRINQAYPIFLNADHTYSLDRIKEVVEAGYDSVIFDGATLSKEENKKRTKEVVGFVKSTRPDMLVEAEIGYIGKSSSLLDELPENAAITEDQMPTSQEIADFVAYTGVDLIAPAVGNIHGMLKNAPNPNLSIDRIREIAHSVSTPIILHGGSGIADQQFTDSIKAGVRMVHINTEIRKAWKQALKDTIHQDENEVAPYKLLEPAKQAVRQVVLNRLKLFNHLDS
jgi:fructose-bisphosphate aldolase, class II